MASIRSCIEQQINEIELLQCCYPSSEEFHLDDLQAFDQAKEFLDGKHHDLQRNLSFILKLHLNDIKTTIEFQCIYPFHYPQSPLEINLRTYLSRECHEIFNEALKQFLNDKTSIEEPYVMQFISWVQDHQNLFLPSNTSTVSKSSSEQLPQQKKKTSYARLWIYSHHIYNSEKRRNIIQWAHELHLHGFSMPGKPGIVCVEGLESDVDEYWTRLRQLTWKKLQMKEKEDLGDSTNHPLRFEQFQELLFLYDNHGKSDFGQFHHYLQERQLEKMFHLFFGFDGTDKK